MLFRSEDFIVVQRMCIEKKAESGLDEEVMERAKSTMALKKLATPEDVAMAILALSSDEVSGHITGQVIEVAGGMEGRLV